MGKPIITEALFPEIIEIYNQNGRSGAYDYLRSNYGIKNPYFVIKRIIGCGRYGYDPERDCFSETPESAEDSIFMGLDELCSATVVKTQSVEPVADIRPAAMEKLVHELISDRLLMLSRYITLDTSSRRILIDQTSLSADGYQVVTH